MTATPGISLVKTSEDLTKEIRRGGKLKRSCDDEMKKEKKKMLERSEI